ncbi:MAG: hypothetical protein ACI4WT_08875 [Oligosphaeraceae bacterium]
MTTYSEQEQRKRNDQALSAWNEWKKKCSVGGCLNPENRHILTGEVTRAFNRELLKALKMAKIISPGENEACWRKPAYECVAEFDGAIREADTERLNRQTGKPRKRKKWKNVVWRKMATSQDAPLKVLRGNLTGPASFMRDAVREYVQRDYQIWNKRCAMSLNAPLGGQEEGATLESQLLDTSSAFDPYLEPSQLTGEEQRQLKASLDATFTLPDMALVLAQVCRVAVSDLLLHFPMGLGPSAAYDRQGLARKKLKTWFSDWMANVNVQDTAMAEAVLEHFFSRLSAENVPEALLYRLNPQKE